MTRRRERYFANTLELPCGCVAPGRTTGHELVLLPRGDSGRRCLTCGNMKAAPCHSVRKARKDEVAA